MFALLYDPVSEIKKSKRQSYSRILLYLLAASLFETVGLVFFAWRYFSKYMTMDILATGIVAVLFFLFAAHLLAAFFFSLTLHILDGKGGYYEGLTALVLAMVAPAVAIFFGGAISFVPYGIILSVVLLAYGYVLGAATLFRAAKELFELDYAGVFVGFVITSVVLGCAVSLTAFLL